MLEIESFNSYVLAINISERAALIYRWLRHALDFVCSGGPKPRVIPNLFYDTPF